MLFPLDNDRLDEKTICDGLERGILHRLGLCNGALAVVMEEVFPDEEDHDAPLPEPTDAPPGSPEKMVVFAERARKGQQLHHPADAPPVGAGADDHEEQTGRANRNGSITRKLCQEAMRNGASIVIGYDPLEVAETLMAHFADGDLRAIVTAIWKESGVRASAPTDRQMREGFVVLGGPVEVRRRRRRRKAGGDARQLTIWPEPQPGETEAA